MGTLNYSLSPLIARACTTVSRITTNGLDRKLGLGMQSIEAFLEDRAAAFSTGQIDRATASQLTPTTLYLGHDIVFVRDRDHMTRLLRNSHDRLCERGYARTSCTIHSVTPLSADGARAHLTWTHLDHDGAPLDEVVVTYFCKKVSGQWQVAMVEFDPDSAAAVMSRMSTTTLDHAPSNSHNT